LKRPRQLAAAIALAAVGLMAASWAPAPASASPQIDYGIQDDAWLLYGRGPIESRMELLQRLGVDVVRYTIRWDQVARRRPATPRNHRSRGYGWETVDPVLRALRRHRIDAVVTLLGTPRWANGGRAFNWAPTSSRPFADFAYAAAKRYSWVRKWTIWNEPNQARWLLPTSAEIYVARLLNPAYAQLHAAIPGVRVAGGVTAPRASSGGRSPVAWIRAMAAAGARLDAYAHHPYPLKPRAETPWQGGCAHCSTITMADLERLVREVRRSFGAKRIWLTEYGYQTNPPDRVLGVSRAAQARYVASAARRAFLTPYVDMLIHFLVRDDTLPAGWQSGFFTSRGLVKPAYWAFRMPVTQARRERDRVDVWGQIRPRSGRQPFRVRLFDGASWRSLGGVRWTNARGFFEFTVRARAGLLVQVQPTRERRPSLAVSLA
jgi:hypothetical protein